MKVLFKIEDAHGDAYRIVECNEGRSIRAEHYEIQGPGALDKPYGEWKSLNILNTHRRTKEGFLKAYKEIIMSSNIHYECLGEEDIFGD